MKSYLREPDNYDYIDTIMKTKKKKFKNSKDEFSWEGSVNFSGFYFMIDSQNKQIQFPLLFPGSEIFFLFILFL